MEQHRQRFSGEITNASAVVNTQLSKLTMLERKFSNMDSKFSAEISNLMKNGNNARAKALANELVNVRRIKNITRNMNLTLEMLVIRFSTLKDFGVIMDTIEPTVDMIKNIQLDISSIVPAASGVLSEMSEVSSEVLNESTRIDGNYAIPTCVDSDALDILTETESAMEQDAKTKLPEIPTEINETIAQSVDNLKMKRLSKENQVLVEI
ncbi:MAG TPA: Snf7 family protein [Nitrososphaeraceae archaeon]|jgi:division protein CdvB (Snf7/Vps24/ESCRT-III family)|nr:Snf7 family protein [Nitrososphaeraceae archaeon]